MIAANVMLRRAVLVLAFFAAGTAMGQQTERTMQPGRDGTGTAGGYRARHVITNEDLETKVQPPADGSSTAISQAPGNADRQPAADASKPTNDAGATSTDPASTKYSLSELRDDEKFLVEDIASLKEQIAVGLVDSRHDVLAHVLQYRLTRLQTVQQQIEREEQRLRALVARSSSAKAQPGKSSIPRPPQSDR